MNIQTKTFNTSTGKTNSISLIQGDIAQVPAQALITAINAGGLWMGGIDSVIMRVADQQFHNQAARRMPLRHLDTIVAKKKSPHRALFQDVIFVVDELEGPLREVVSVALQAAGNAGYTTVSLPAIRTGVMLGVVEDCAATAVGELLTGIRNHYTDFPNSPISSISFVVYESGEVLKLIQNSKLLIEGK